MRAFVVVASLLSCAAAAPSYAATGLVASHGLTAAAIGPVQTQVHLSEPVAHVHETVHAGPAIAEHQVHHGVVGHRTVQVGAQQVQVGHQYNVVGKEVIQPESYSVVAGPPVSTKNTVALPAPALPVAAPAAAVIPPAPRNLGPAPADTVTQQKVLALARAHTVITPRVTRIEPELHINKVPYEVRVEQPYPVHRDVVVEKRVQKPYTVEVPRAVPVEVPYKVHPVQEVVHTPVVRQHTVSVSQPAIHTATVAHAAPVAVAHSAVAAAPVAVEGYAAAPVAVEGYAAAPVAIEGYAAAPAAAYAGYATAPAAVAAAPVAYKAY